MTKTTHNEQFSSRWGLILASLGMAIGAGNLWRFPRIAGQYGGTFLILWTLFLFVWSIPILMTEFSIGKRFKKGVIASFAGAVGKNFTWMGVFIALCTLGITFYYSVVTAWGMRYLGMSLSFLFSQESLGSELAQNPSYLKSFWEQISNGNILTLVLHALAVGIGILVLFRGIQKGLEQVNKFLIPSLFILMLVVAAVALNTENGVKGLYYMFSVDMSLFRDPQVWIEALSQSAWSTGAGWGLMLTISSYSRDKEDVTMNIFISGVGNNVASMVAGIAILPSVFAVAGNEQEAISFLQSGNQALTFTVIPQLYTKIAGGNILSVVFFLAFTLAAFSSLLTMLELFIRLVTDMGLTRKSATVVTGVACLIFGFPSAWSLDFFSNQDWVWGIGLIVSGLFIIFVAFKNDIFTYKERFIDKDSDFKVPNVYYIFTLVLNIPLGALLIWWWMSRGYSESPWFTEDGTWNMMDVYSNATIITQWGLVLLLGIILNGWLYKYLMGNGKPKGTAVLQND
ncbi:sodium-dependent transporter [Limibacter armeniacum]|uniref:sodium-dependent transporter n=1 Tax=Limibacter armeniacum TaxID=466084 RepID=UPI002FE5D2F3